MMKSASKNFVWSFLNKKAQNYINMKNIKTLLLCLLTLGTLYQSQAQFQTAMGKPGETNLQDSKTLNVTSIRKGGHIQVTNPRYDHIGEILTKIDFEYRAYEPSKKPYMIFVNCGTNTPIDPQELHDYVANGGVLYASDLSDEVLMKTFPGIFHFEGRQGQTGSLEASIEDADLQDVLGDDMTVHFDLKGWAILNEVEDSKVLMRAKENGKPLMIEVAVGKGKVFYTCFHNHKQASGKEEALLKLLITKQVSSLVEQPFAETAQEMGLDLVQMRMEFKE